jgi:hypothetical protein
LYNSKILKKYISNKAIVEVQEFGAEFERDFFWAELLFLIIIIF